MKKKAILGAAVLTTLFLISTTAYSWNFATHAYIADKIGRFLPLVKANFTYGIMAPDLFNTVFSLTDDNLLLSYTHGIPKEDPNVHPSEAFMAVWWKAHGVLQKAGAAGYVAHNDAWAADYIAHWKAIPPLPRFPAPYQDVAPGYIKSLAVELDKILAANGIWAGVEAALGFPLGIPDRMMFTENIVEYAGDLLIRKADPQIGQKIADAATIRTPEFPELLIKAFPGKYKDLIGPAEQAFRWQMIQYGGMLQSYTDDEIITVVAQQMAQFSIDYLAFKTGLPPSAFEGIRTQLETLSYNSMYIAVPICEGARFMDEVRLTALYVSIQLLLHQVNFYWLW